MRISITTPNCVRKLGANGCGWIYADGDLETFRLTQNALGESSHLVSADTFQQAALDLQAPFVHWVDECMSTAPRSHWLATPLSKNPSESNLFLHLVWMALIDQAVMRGKSAIIVVTSSHGLALALAELSRIRGWECKRYGKINSLFRHWHCNLIALAKWLGKLLLLIHRIIVARRIFTNEYVATRLADTELLLETYILEGDIGEDGSCKDRYFPGLMAYYHAQGIRACYFPHLYRIPLRRLRGIYVAMRRSDIAFAPLEAFITFRDMFMAAWASVCHGLSFNLRTPLVFQNMPVGSLVGADCFTAGLRGFMPFVFARAPRRMAEMGIKPKWFIDWFENQTLDKGVVLGFGDGLPECHTIAVRQYVPFSNFLSLLSSSGEVKAGVAPAENWVCGEALKQMASRFDAVGKYSAVPALRYSYIHHPPTAIAGLADTLLVILTHSVEESMAILDCIVPLCREKGAEISRFVVKTHQAMNRTLFWQKVERRFTASEINIVEWTDLKLSELLPTAKVVVTSGSSAAVEAICRGIPVVLIGRQAGLNFIPLIEINPRMWAIAYTPNDLKEIITQRFCEEQLPEAERVAIAENTRKAFFMETENDGMRRFLPAERR